MKTIIVVDDDAALVRACEKILVHAGYSVVTAANGDEALRVLARTPVDLMLLDVMMPEKDGFEILMLLRAKHSAVPVISMSGNSDVAPATDMLAQCKRLGAQVVLPKPFTEAELLAAVAGVASDSGSPASIAS